jgi:hypothetical protein
VTPEPSMGRALVLGEEQEQEADEEQEDEEQ